MSAEPERTEGHLLGGSVRYAQPKSGFRSGIEPVLLAAAVPAGPNDRVLEGGCGAGAALLCLTARMPSITGLGVDCDPAFIKMAQENARANRFNGLSFSAADVECMGRAGTFDHALANPPYHPPGGTASPIQSREMAKRSTAQTLHRWAVALGSRLRHRGTLTFIVTAAVLPDCINALAAVACPPRVIFPFWPRTNRPAKLVLVQGMRGSRFPLRLAPGLVLHTASGRFTPEAEAVLRDKAVLDL